jgi:hypothetical protein
MNPLDTRKKSGRENFSHKFVEGNQVTISPVKFNFHQVEPDIIELIINICTAFFILLETSFYPGVDCGNRGFSGACN